MTPLSLLTAHRYWLTASLMRKNFRSYLSSHPKLDIEHPDLLSSLGIWYATLYVAVEGWFSFEVSDTEMDLLRRGPRMELLKDFRNGTVHVQNEYIGSKLTAFFSAEGAAEWVERLHQRTGEVIVRELEAHGRRQCPS